MKTYDIYDDISLNSS